MRIYVLYGVLAWAAVILQSSVLSVLFPSPYIPDLVFLLVLYSAITQSLWTGVFCAFLCGYFIGVFSGSPVSLWILVYIVSFFLARPVSKWFSPDSRVLHAGYPFVFTFVKSLLLLIAIRVFSREMAPFPWVIQGALGEAIVNSAIAFFIFPALKYSERTPRASFEW